MPQLLPFLIADFAVLLVVMAFFIRRSSYFHPLTFYLFFHVYSFTFRAWELYSGKYPMYFGMQTHHYYSAIQPEEFVRALIVADGALIMFAIGCFGAGLKPIQRVAGAFDDRKLILSLILLLPISIALFAARRFGGVGANEILTGYQLLSIISGGWPIACIALAIARWGFRWYLAAAAIIYLGLVATQGYHRFMALQPLILLVGIYLAQHRRAWPGGGSAALLVIGALIFPSLKAVGREFQSGGIEGATGALSIFAVDYDPAATRSEWFFDQFAGALTAADGLLAPLLGKTYVALLTLPIPRALWPDKPSLGNAASFVTVPGRPYDVEGRIVTVIGEAYLNFGYFGVVLVMTLLGYLLTRFYLKAFSVSVVDPYKLIYIGLASTYLQFYRDGIPSLVLYSLLVMAPVYLYYIAHMLTPTDRGRASAMRAFRTAS